MELKQNKRLPRTRAKARAKTMATANRVELCRLDCSCLSNANYKIKYARTRARISPRAMHRQLEPETRRVREGHGGERAGEIFGNSFQVCWQCEFGSRVATVTSKTRNVLSLRLIVKNIYRYMYISVARILKQTKARLG